MPAHVRHVGRIVAAAVLRVVEQPALIPQPPADGEVRVRVRARVSVRVRFRVRARARARVRAKARFS